MVAYDSYRWILTGGRDGGQVFSDAYVLEVVSTPLAGVTGQAGEEACPRLCVTVLWTRLHAALPSPRFFHAMCNVQNACAALLLCGGLGEAALSGDPSPAASGSAAQAFCTLHIA